MGAFEEIGKACSCCAIAIANGDQSGCRYYHGDHAARVSAALSRIGWLVVTGDCEDGRACVVCGDYGVSGDYRMISREVS